MIASRCFELEWIEARRKELGAADPGILEKAIHALALLSGLVRSECDLVFKGGTALLLHLPEFRRLSIDIDIVCSEPKAEFERRLDSIIPSGPFIRWEEHLRGDRGLPKRRHYKFYYPSPTQGEKQEPILLDVVEEPNVIADLVERPILVSFIECEEETLVRLPSVESAALKQRFPMYVNIEIRQNRHISNPRISGLHRPNICVHRPLKCPRPMRRCPPLNMFLWWPGEKNQPLLAPWGLLPPL
jgi:hypothetical protein